MEGVFTSWDLHGKVIHLLNHPARYWRHIINGTAWSIPNSHPHEDEVHISVQSMHDTFVCHSYTSGHGWVQRKLSISDHLRCWYVSNLIANFLETPHHSDLVDTFLTGPPCNICITITSLIIPEKYSWNIPETIYKMLIGLEEWAPITQIDLVTTTSTKHFNAPVPEFLLGIWVIQPLPSRC